MVDGRGYPLGRKGGQVILWLNMAKGAKPKKAKRLNPVAKTLRELFLKSGNLCAYPGCGRLMMNVEGVFTGQVCHIEAAEEDGERFNPAMTNEQRRHVSNLMLMCYDHHQETNDVAKFPVEKLRRMKEDHEKRFSQAERAILESMRDRTAAVQPKAARNLKRLNELPNWRVPEGDLPETVALINSYLERLQKVPLQVRHFLGAISMRAHVMQDTRAVEYPRFGDVMILVSDLQGAFGLSWEAVVDMAHQLDDYGLGTLDEIETFNGSKPAVRIRSLDGWNVWKDIASFCKKEGVPMETFSDALDFTPFDG
jgi:hypothetical protein